MFQPVMFSATLRTDIHSHGRCVIFVIFALSSSLVETKDFRFYWKIVSSLYCKIFIRKRVNMIQKIVNTGLDEFLLLRHFERTLSRIVDRRMRML